MCGLRKFKYASPLIDFCECWMNGNILISAWSCINILMQATFIFISSFFLRHCIFCMWCASAVSHDRTWFVSFFLASQVKVFEPFSILGIEPGVSDSDIKKAYRRLSIQYHPDKNPDPGYRFYLLFPYLIFTADWFIFCFVFEDLIPIHLFPPPLSSQRPTIILLNTFQRLIKPWQI